MRRILRALFRVRLIGDLAALEGGHRLVVANHDSLLDGVLLGLFLPASASVVVTRDALRHPVVRLFSRAVKFVVLDPTRPLALKRLIREVQRGGTVAIFPQGRVTTTGTTMKVYDSAGLIAARADAVIVPVHIAGTLYSRFSAVGGAYPKRWLPRVTLTVQPPLKMSAKPNVNGRDRRHRLADEMLKILQGLAVDARPRQTLFEALLGAARLHGHSTAIVEDARQQPES
jgi:acyl-[acyl-carrier-protein]-phospholipid O-acyltransferase/long-chain-fatty-acid--[acyl-carrier-protein] ligase